MIHQVLSFEEFCDIVEGMSIAASSDLGGALVHTGSHPDHGSIIMINTAGEKSLMIKV